MSGDTLIPALKLTLGTVDVASVAADDWPGNCAGATANPVLGRRGDRVDCGLRCDARRAGRGLGHEPYAHGDRGPGPGVSGGRGSRVRLRAVVAGAVVSGR